MCCYLFIHDNYHTLHKQEHQLLPRMMLTVKTILSNIVRTMPCQATKTASAYFTSEQIQSFGVAEQYCGLLNFAAFCSRYKSPTEQRYALLDIYFGYMLFLKCS